jgi:hypothetical protein
MCIPLGIFFPSALYRMTRFRYPSSTLCIAFLLLRLFTIAEHPGFDFVHVSYVRYRTHSPIPWGVTLSTVLVPYPECYDAVRPSIREMLVISDIIIEALVCMLVIQKLQSR